MATDGLASTRSEPGAGHLAAKRCIDIALALAGLFALAPLLLLIAVAIRLSSPGPALYRQSRHGLHGAPFAILKFRTLRHGSGGFEQVLPGDQRVSRLGQLLRRSRLDELPQLWNVLRGEMSLVGPRPHAVRHGEACADLLPGYHLRHRMRPGMTGLAQVSGCRGPVLGREDLERRIERDLAYIRGWSLGLDLAILLRTPGLWFGRGRREP